MMFIITKDIKKSYQLGKTEVKALRGLDLTIDKGEFICIAGPSGAGKSTLLNIIGLLDKPTSGQLIFNNTDVDSLNNKELHAFRKKNIGFIFQSFHLIPVLNAYENIEFPLLLRRIKKTERLKIIEKMAKEVGIVEKLKHRPDELSGGQRQRVAITRALVTRPEIVIADEPTANLDSVTGKNILELMKFMKEEENTTFIIATHDNSIMKYADRVIKIVDGSISE